MYVKSKRILFIIMCICLVIFGPCTPVNAGEAVERHIFINAEKNVGTYISVNGEEDIDMSMYDFGGIDEVLDRSEYEGQSFSDMVDELLKGDSEGIFIDIFSMAGDKLFGEIGYNKDVIIRVVLLAVAAAMLSKLSAMFVNSKMSDMGFFSVYTLLMVLLVAAFAVNAQVATDIVSLLLDFMKCLIPAFFFGSRGRLWGKYLPWLVRDCTGVYYGCGIYSVKLCHTSSERVRCHTYIKQCP